MGVWLGLWALSIVVGIGLFYLAGPKIPGVGENINKFRQAILTAGFIPMFGLNILVSIFFFLTYKARTIGKASTSAGLNSRLAGQAADLAPAVERPVAKPASSDNPFL